MKSEEAAIKAKIVSRDFIGKEAEHKGSKRKCIITAVEARARQSDAENYEVVCIFTPMDNEILGKTLSEEIEYFLSTYKILNPFSPEKKV